MDANLRSEAAYPPPIPAFPCFETGELHQRIVEDMNPKVIQIDRREVSEWTLSGARRTFDILLSLVALIVFFPIMCAVALAIRLSSPGPILFQQQRMGRNGRVFVLHKFRSMRLASEQFSAITVTGDNRVTRVGKILRKCKLDELPQFWNVLRGQMSMVGPRPVTAAELHHYQDRIDYYLAVRPGLTGAWQVGGRSTTTYAERVEMDVDYVRNWTFWRDMRIVLRTVAVVLHGKGAH